MGGLAAILNAAHGRAAVEQHCRHRPVDRTRARPIALRGSASDEFDDLGFEPRYATLAEAETVRFWERTLGDQTAQVLSGRLAGSEKVVIIGTITNSAQANGVVSAAVQMSVRTNLVERRPAIAASWFH
jgi:hypothetical protein